jgi:hypothetical protein
MKLLITNYNFNAAAKTIVFNDYTLVYLQGLLMITNVSNSAKPVLYQFNNTGLTATVVNNIVTLGYNTTAMNNYDALEIFYDDILQDTKRSEEAILLRRLIDVMESNGTVDSNNRQKIAVEVMPSITVSSAPTTAVSGTLTSAGTVTSVGQLAGVDSRYQIIDWARVAYNTLRSNIIFN